MIKKTSHWVPLLTSIFFYILAPFVIFFTRGATIAVAFHCLTVVIHVSTFEFMANESARYLICDMEN
jgi:hypothetical protein